MKVGYGILITLLVMLGLSGCGDPHKGMHCVAQQRELLYINHVKIASGFYISQPVYGTVCVQWVANTPSPSHS